MSELDDFYDFLEEINKFCKIQNIPASTASSVAYCINGLSTIVSISLGFAFVAGKNLIISPLTLKVPRLSSS